SNIRGGGSIEVQVVRGKGITISTRPTPKPAGSSDESGSYANPKDLRVEPGSTAADDATWDREDPGVDGDGKPYTGYMTYVVRTEWDDTAGELLAFKRELLVDSSGRE